MAYKFELGNKKRDPQTAWVSPQEPRFCTPKETKGEIFIEGNSTPVSTKRQGAFDKPRCKQPQSSGFFSFFNYFKW